MSTNNMFAVLSMLENSVGAYGSALSLIANRATNTSTTGYKEPQYAFSTLFTQQFYGSSAVSNGLGRAQGSSVHNVGSGSQLVMMGHSMTQGERRQATQHDAFIAGTGFFITQSAMDQQRTLTRNGVFRFDSSGFLLDEAGNYVLGHPLKLKQVEDENGNLVDPEPAQGQTHFSVDQHEHAGSGLVRIRFDISKDENQPTQVGIDQHGYIYSSYGQLPTSNEAIPGLNQTDENGNEVPIPAQAQFQLAIGSVSNPSALELTSSGNSYQTSAASGEMSIVSHAASNNAASLGGNSVEGGFFEASNVKIGELLVEGVQIQRSYNAVQSVLGMVAKFMSNFFSTVDKVAA